MLQMILSDGSNGILTEPFRGACAETYAIQVLCANGRHPMYWTPGDISAEIEFVTSDENGSTAPIEVESGANVRSRGSEEFHGEVRMAAEVSYLGAQLWSGRVCSRAFRCALRFALASEDGARRMGARLAR